MSSFSQIQQKLEEFIKKYYTSELIKGTIFFFAAGFFVFFTNPLNRVFFVAKPHRKNHFVLVFCSC